MPASPPRTARRKLLLAAVALFALPTVWWLTAYPRGMAAAWIDGLRGHDEIRAFGLQGLASQEIARLLSERYGVGTRRVAGCVVSQDLVWHVRGYNAVVRSRIDARFAKDVLAECIADAESSPECAESAPDSGTAPARCPK